MLLRYRLLDVRLVLIVCFDESSVWIGYFGMESDRVSEVVMLFDSIDGLESIDDWHSECGCDVVENVKRVALMMY